VPLMSVDDAATRCTNRTKGVIVMHYAGYLADADVWREFADKRGIALIEDSAHAVGAARSRIFGDLAVFSFFGNKNMTTAEGGMILGADEELMAAARMARGHGMTTSTVQRLNGQALYDVTTLGFNYRMTELSAALGLVQLRKLPGWNSRRKALSAQYRELLRDTGVSIPFTRHGSSTHHILPVLLPESASRTQVIAELRGEGVQTSFHYPPIHSLSWYRHRYPGVRLPVTEMFSSRELTVPLHPKMDDTQVECVTSALRHILAGCRKGSS
jgi:dTDP-4-amino-4,6-dideoxygalactose transaminase